MSDIGNPIREHDITPETEPVPTPIELPDTPSPVEAPEPLVPA